MDLSVGRSTLRSMGIGLLREATALDLRLTKQPLKERAAQTAGAIRETIVWLDCAHEDRLMLVQDDLLDQASKIAALEAIVRRLLTSATRRNR